MMETIEYLGTMTVTCTSRPLGGKLTGWMEGETVIIREIVGIPNFGVIKLKNRLKNMIVKGSEFTYYKPQWVKLR